MGSYHAGPKPTTTDRFAVWRLTFGSWGRTNSDVNAVFLNCLTGSFFIGAHAPVSTPDASARQKATGVTRGTVQNRADRRRFPTLKSQLANSTQRAIQASGRESFQQGTGHAVAALHRPFIHPGGADGGGEEDGARTQTGPRVRGRLTEARGAVRLEEDRRSPSTVKKAVKKVGNIRKRVEKRLGRRRRSWSAAGRSNPGVRGFPRRRV